MPQFKQIALVLFATSTLLSWGQEAGALRHDDSLRVQQSNVAFELDLLPELPEALAYDPVDSLWYFGMVKTGKVYSYNPRTEKLKLFLGDDPDGRNGVFSLEIDTERRVLYVLSSPVGLFHGAAQKPCTLYEYYLGSGVLLSRNDFYDGDERRLLGDMERYKDGSIFISDSYYPAIIRRTPEGNMKEFLFRPDKFRSLQGLALDSKAGLLYAADYRNGLFAIDIFTGEIVGDTASIDGHSLRGIDGLSLYRKGRKKVLYGVQNGTVPNRLVAVSLSADGRTFRAVEALDQNCFPTGEPTNGVFVKNQYFYIANSPWPYFDENGEPLDVEHVWKSTLQVRSLQLIE